MLGFLNKDNANNSNNNNDTNNQNNQQNQNNSNNNDDNNSNNNNNNNSNDNNNDNNNNNVDNNVSIWDNNDSNNDNTDQQQNQNNQQNNQNNQNNETRSAGEQFNEHVASLKLADNVDLSKIQEDIQAGDMTSLQEAFSTIAANTYKASLQQMNQLADNKIEAAIEKAVAESSSVVNENLAITDMRNALPFAADKNIAPVAEAALKQFIAKGSSVQDAIKQVAAFFQSTADAVSQNGQAPTNLNNGSFNPNTNTNQQNNDSNKDDDTWMSFLSN